LRLWNRLYQTLVRLTCPGAPDIYQGNELWDFSVVDPDNRHPVDYNHHRKIFEGLREWGNAPEPPSIACLLKTPEDGRIKAYLIWRTLCLRQEQANVFLEGDYLPLSFKGAKSEHAVAFARKHGDALMIIVAPRLISG